MLLLPCSVFTLLVKERPLSSVDSLLQSRACPSPLQFGVQAILNIDKAGDDQEGPLQGTPWTRQELVSLPRNLVSQIPKAGP